MKVINRILDNATLYAMLIVTLAATIYFIINGWGTKPIDIIKNVFIGPVMCLLVINLLRGSVLKEENK
jgi:predicted permease